MILTYETITPNANYAPWQMDDIFNSVIKDINGYTLVDNYRLFELWELVHESSKLDNGDIIEIGTYRGGSGAVIAKQASIVCPDIKVYLCDTFQGLVKASSKDKHSNGEFSAPIEDVLFLISKMQLSNVEILTGIFPEETSKELNEKQFRFCHVDVDIYQSGLDILKWIWSRMVVGGIMVYDDYGFPSCYGITFLVNEQKKMDDRLVLYNLNGHAIVIKLK